MIYIGIDPAVAKQTAVAVVTPDNTHLLLVDTFKAGDLLYRLDCLGLSDLPICLTIEAQEIYRGSAARTRTILELANRSGFFEGLLVGLLPNIVEIRRPVPKEWKGQVSADMYRKRTLKKHAIVADITSGMTRLEQEDLAHAYGLAIWKKL